MIDDAVTREYHCMLEGLGHYEDYANPHRNKLNGSRRGMPAATLSGKFTVEDVWDELKLHGVCVVSMHGKKQRFVLA